MGAAAACLGAAALIVAWRWVIALVALWFTVVLYHAVVNWWLPYFAGIHRGEITPDIYRRQYSANVTVLSWLSFAAG